MEKLSTSPAQQLNDMLENTTKLHVFITDENPAYKKSILAGCTMGFHDRLSHFFPAQKPSIKEVAGVYQGNAEKAYLLSFDVSTIAQVISTTEAAIEMGKSFGQDSILTYNEVAGAVLFKCQTGKVDAFGRGYEIKSSPDQLSDKEAYSIVDGAVLRFNLV